MSRMSISLCVALLLGASVFSALGSAALDLTVPSGGASNRGSRFFGVELFMEQEAQTILLYMHPSEHKATNLTVLNEGNVTDTFMLNVSIDYRGLEKNGWKVWLNYYEIESPAMNYTKLAIYAQAANNCTPGDYIDVNITATSQNDSNVKDSIEFRVGVDCPCNGISLTFSDNIHMVSPGETVEFQGVVKNLDPWNYTVQLTITDAPFDWNITINPTEVMIGSKTLKSVLITVTPPIDALADQMGSITVKATTKGCNEFTERHTVHAIVSPYLIITMSALGPTTLYVDPWEEAKFDIDLLNTGNLPNPVIYILGLEGNMSDWTAYLDRTSISLERNVHQTVHLTLVPPLNCAAGEKVIVTISGNNEQRTYQTEVMVEVVCKAVHALNLELSSLSVQLDPGGQGGLELTISNDGNGLEFMTGDIIGPVGWKGGFQDKGLWVKEFAVEANSSKVLKLNVEVPLEALEGTYNLTVFFDNGGDINLTMTFSVVITHIPSILIECSKPRQIGQMGNNVTFPIEIKNLGNGKDTIDITALNGLPRSWTFAFVTRDGTHIKNMILNIGETLKISLNVSIPGHPEKFNVQFDVLARSRNGPSMNIPLEIEVKTPDLAFMTGVHGLKGAVKGKPYCFELKISNNGSIPAGPVEIELYIDGVYLSQKALDLLSPGTPANLSFCWTPTTIGNHMVKFVLDPQDKIAEANEDNNAFELQVIVPKKTVQQPGFETVQQIVAIIVVAIATIELRRRIIR